MRARMILAFVVGFAATGCAGIEGREPVSESELADEIRIIAAVAGSVRLAPAGDGICVSKRIEASPILQSLSPFTFAEAVRRYREPRQDRRQSSSRTLDPGAMAAIVGAAIDGACDALDALHFSRVQLGGDQAVVWAARRTRCSTSSTLYWLRRQGTGWRVSDDFLVETVTDPVCPRSIIDNPHDFIRIGRRGGRMVPRR